MPFDPSTPSPIASIPDTSWPTIRQLAAIGAVSTTWSWLDMGIETLICTLTESDEMLGQALTQDLSPDNRLKALRRLTTTWERMVLGMTKPQTELLADIRSCVSWVAKNKTTRNKVVHSLWMRSDDEKLFGWKHHIAPVTAKESSSVSITVSEILNFSIEIGQMVVRLGELELAARELPPFPKPSRAIPLTPALDSLLGPYRSREAP